MSTPSQAIKHVFVLMLENRSFDHMLGFSGITGNDAETGKPTQINGLKGTESNSEGGTSYPVTTPADWTMPVDPNHEFPNVVTQLCGAGVIYPKGGNYPPINNSGFVADYVTVKKENNPGELMKCYEPTQVPALVTLAREFALCDSWFSSLPGPTWPNRFFVNAASSGGLDASPTNAQLAEWNTVEGFEFQNGTLFSKHGLSWAIYVSSLVGNISGALSGIHTWNLSEYSKFAHDLQSGYSKQYTFIEPDYGDMVVGTYRGGNSQHPMDDVRSGDQLIADVYNAIRNSPLWPNSMLIITWDEHGGFYDHVAPPAAIAPGDVPQMHHVNTNGFTFTQYGVRVPAVVISPLIARNVIDHRVYDHASIAATVEKLYGLSPMTARDRAANNLTSLVTLTSPRMDCPTSVSSSPVSSAPATPARAPETAATTTTKLQESLDKGNLPGFVLSAMRRDIDVSPPEQKSAIIARVSGLSTRADARAYIDEVQRKLESARNATAPEEGR